MHLLLEFCYVRLKKIAMADSAVSNPKNYSDCNGLYYGTINICVQVDTLQLSLIIFAICHAKYSQCRPQEIHKLMSIKIIWIVTVKKSKIIIYIK